MKTRVNRKFIRSIRNAREIGAGRYEPASVTTVPVYARWEGSTLVFEVLTLTREVEPLGMSPVEALVTSADSQASRSKSQRKSNSGEKLVRYVLTESEIPCPPGVIQGSRLK